MREEEAIDHAIERHITTYDKLVINYEYYLQEYNELLELLSCSCDCKVYCENTLFLSYQLLKNIFIKLEKTFKRTE